MNQVQLYSKYNSLQKHDASFVLDNYMRLIKWQSNESILDIGCGDGQVTLDLLLPRLPKNFRKLVGADVSDEMVKFADTNSKNSKVAFVQFDISTNSIPADFEEEFHHIFSFYCLHWIYNQKQAFRNIYDVLKPGGDVLLTFLASNPIFDVYENMAKTSKWFPYMQNVKKYISPYHHSENPEKELEELLMKLGFITHLCRVEKRSYMFPSWNILRKSVSAVNPFISSLSQNEINNYIDDYILEVRKLENVTIETCDNNNEERVNVHYKLFVVFASKPL